MSVISGVVGAITGSNASSSAANTQADASNNAANLQAEATKQAIAESQRQYDLSRADLVAANEQGRADTAPWRTAGGNALTQLVGKINAGPGDYTKSPGYDFRLSEGNKAIERSAAARGSVLGAGTLKALDRYGQDYATSDYDNILRRYYEGLTPLQSLAGVGQSTASQTASQGGQTAANLASLGSQYASSNGGTTMAGAAGSGNALMAGANATASGQINSANAITGSLRGASNNALQGYQLWKLGQKATAASEYGALSEAEIADYLAYVV